MNTLIITVGNRQVGWHSPDGVRRSLGADGERGNPSHVDELYRELEQERGYHDPTDTKTRWSVAHLGEQLYRRCGEDFRRVILLMDSPLLAAAEALGIHRVVLWGTAQPETVAWVYRRTDTRWLAELMAGWIRQHHPHIETTVWCPSVAVNDADGIRQAVESLLLELVTHHTPRTLFLQTKGGAPPITNPLEIAAAALIRQFPVERLEPIDPTPLFDGPQVCPATVFKRLGFGEYFWPVERSRIRSAWERGDFAEAKVWLQAHTDRHEALYELAQHLSLAVNWQWQDVLKALQGNGQNDWLSRSDLDISRDQRKQWRADVQAQNRRQEIPESKFLKLWESRWLIYLHLVRQNYTAAFFQIVQVLERLLYWRCEQEQWLVQGHITAPAGKKGYKPTFYDLRLGWLRCHQLPEDSPIGARLEEINECRNGVVHNSRSLNQTKLSKLMDCPDGLPAAEMYAHIENFLQSFGNEACPIPSRSLFRELYEWGLQRLQA